ncbi:hypothetical protein AMECASPLE_038235 [Ameca splendens]|uniref:Uncharacterized protein n=1 Tax=Ameca splendens TaxID=208324 RepID=A0ABV0XX49_9TELE
MGPQRWKTLAALQWRTRTPRPSMSGNVMELAEGGARGWEGKDWGPNRSPPPNHPDPQTSIPSPVTQSAARSSHRPPTNGSQPEAPKRPRMWPHSKKNGCNCLVYCLCSVSKY